jgi:phosphatidate cytidylyltransferase
MPDLLNRIIVAVPLAVLAIAAVYQGGWFVVVFAALAGVISVHELFAMARATRPMALAGQAGTLIAIVGAHWAGVEWVVAAIPITLLLAFVLSAAVAMKESATVSIAVSLLAPCWIGVGLAALVLLRDLKPNDFGLNILFAVLLGTWASDIFAYFGGRLFGKRRLAPAISPKKTVEGFLIGFVFGAVTVWWTLYAIEDHVTHVQAAILGIVVALVAPLGDLFESFLKRDLGVKDSGRLLGGHGGVLDRIDAMLFAFPAAWIALDVMSRV